MGVLIAAEAIILIAETALYVPRAAIRNVKVGLLIFAMVISSFATIAACFANIVSNMEACGSMCAALFTFLPFYSFTFQSAFYLFTLLLFYFF